MPSIIWTPFPFLNSDRNFNSLPGREDSEKLKKEWKYGAGAGLFKRRGLVLFLFNFFKIYHF